MFLADFFQSQDHRAVRVDVLDFLVDLQTDLLDVVSKSSHLRLGLLMNLLGEHSAPILNVSLQGVLHAVCLQRKSSNLVSSLNFLNTSLKLLERLQFLLVVFKGRLIPLELLEGILGLVRPEPAIVGKALQEFAHRVLGALNRTSQKKDNLNNFLVFSNPVVEWLSFVFRLVLLEPKLHFFGGFEHVRSSTVNG